MKIQVQNIIRLLGVVILGFLGAIVFEIIILPFLLANPDIAKTPLLKVLQREVYNYPVQRIIVQESNSLITAIENVSGAVVVLGKDEKEQACGFVLTSDGLVVSPISFASIKQNFIFFNGKKTGFEVLSQDKKNEIALLKVSQQNLKTTSFVDLENIKAGERVFAFKKQIATTSATSTEKDLNIYEIVNYEIVNEGIIKTVQGLASQDPLIETNMTENKNFNGCAMFNFRGEFLGLSKIIDKGNVFILPNNIIRELSSQNPDKAAQKF